MITQLKMRAFSALLFPLFCALYASTASAQVGTTPTTTQPSTTTMGTTGQPPVLTDWTESDRNLANSTMKVYGNPVESANGTLTWRNNGPWQSTIVTRAPRSMQMDKNQMGGTDQPQMNTDNTGSTTQPPYHAFQQTIAYRVPADYYDDLEQFDKNIMVDREKGTLTFYGDQEALNYLSVNLVNDIVTGKRTAAQARAYYDQMATGYAKGEKSPYTSGLTFKSTTMTPGTTSPTGTTPSTLTPPVNGNQPAMPGKEPAKKPATTTPKTDKVAPAPNGNTRSNGSGN